LPPNTDRSDGTEQLYPCSIPNYQKKAMRDYQTHFTRGSSNVAGRVSKIYR
jgi:hypothetical protein